MYVYNSYIYVCIIYIIYIYASAVRVAWRACNYFLINFFFLCDQGDGAALAVGALEVEDVLDVERDEALFTLRVV